MTQAVVYDAEGKQVGEVALGPVFDLKPHTAVLHEAVAWQLAGRRRGTHATLTRGLVDRTTRKLYRQKGTGRARHGARGAPVFVGGGVAFGPHPRAHGYALPKRVRRLALRSALAAKAQAGRIAILDRLELERPKTHALAVLVRALGWEGPILLITSAPHTVIERSAANLRGVRVLPATALNVHDILASEHLLLTRDALGRITEALA